MDGEELNIKRIDLARHNTETLTDRKRFYTGMPAVSPDGKWIAFAGQRNAGQSYDQTKNSIWLLELRTGEIHSLEKTPGQGRAPSWSPDGTRLAFESSRAGDGGFRPNYAVFTIGRDGTGLRQVTDLQVNANHPVWSPDGKRLVVVSADVILVRPVEVKVDHLSEDGGFEAAIDADSGASRGDTGIEASGNGYSRDCARARTISGDGAAISAGSEGDSLRAA